MRVTNPLFVRSDPTSGYQGCASLTAVDGGHIVVGKVLTDNEATAAAEFVAANGHPIAPGEVAVFVPAGTILDAGS